MIEANETFNGTWPFKPHFTNAGALSSTMSMKARERWCCVSMASQLGAISIAI